ncbi:MAG TPA: mechanosensitive ion channel family protein [Bryobacteraceae bacterium]|nr:mechanosensitive ion channel family protein [Bryobacteraceae bacterium]
MSKIVLVIALLFCICGSAQILPASATKSSPPQATDPLNRETPQSSVEAFLEAAHAKNYGRAWRYMDLRSLPESERLDEGTELAKQLQSILDHDVQFDVANLSRNPEGDLSDNLPPNFDRVDTFHVDGRTLELELERITLRSGIKVWVFSADSVKQIPVIAQLTDSSAIERHLPLPLVNIKFIDTALWRWIGLALLAFVLAAISKWLSRFVLWLTRQAVKRLSPGANLTTFETFIGPLRLLLAVSFFRAGMIWLGPSALLRLYLGRLLAFLFFCGLFWLCSVIIDAVVRHLRLRLESRHRAFSYSVLPLSGRIAKIVVFVFIIAAVLTAWGYNTTTLLAGLGIGGVAIALASQKTIENLFGSVSVISDRPVSVGDFCKFGSSMGTVEDIGLRSTRIRTLDRTLVTVPNGSFSTMTLENFNRKDKNLFHVTLNLKRDTTPSQMRTVLDSITSLVKDQPKFEAGDVPVRFIGIGAYSLDVEIFLYMLTLDGDEFLRLQQDLLLRIMEAIHAAGTALALPTQANVTYAAPAPSVNGPDVQQLERPAKQSGSRSPAASFGLDRGPG